MERASTTAATRRNERLLTFRRLGPPQKNPAGLYTCGGCGFGSSNMRTTTCLSRDRLRDGELLCHLVAVPMDKLGATLRSGSKPSLNGELAYLLDGQQAITSRLLVDTTQHVNRVGRQKRDEDLTLNPML